MPQKIVNEIEYTTTGREVVPVLVQYDTEPYDLRSPDEIKEGVDAEGHMVDAHIETSRKVLLRTRGAEHKTIDRNAYITAKHLRKVKAEEVRAAALDPKHAKNNIKRARELLGIK